MPDRYLNFFSLIYLEFKNYKSFVGGADVSSEFGAFYLFGPIMMHFIITINDILREK
jgi:hypothetical protein